MSRFRKWQVLRETDGSTALGGYLNLQVGPAAVLSAIICHL